MSEPDSKETHFECEDPLCQCGRVFKTKSSLRRHAIRRKRLCGYICPELGCGRDFLFPSELRIHVRSHTGERPFKCPQCDYASTTRGNLVVHMRRHTGEKPYRCSICDFASSQAAGVTVHMSVHTSRGLHVCSLCDFTTSRKESLFRHTWFKHGGSDETSPIPARDTPAL